jgi:CDP-diacylglycerol--serine O-phosphatidyltransferase
MEADRMTSPAGAFDLRNLLTYASLLFALAGIAVAQRGHAGAAGALLAAAAMADTLDGRFARRFEASAVRCAFGAELDSLSDAIAFGVAPVVCATLLAPATGSVGLALWWLGAFAYAACAITRLGFYNVTASQARGFVGLPVPVCALIWSTALLARPTPLAGSVVMVACAAAMVAPIRLPRPAGVGFAIFLAWPVTLLLAHAATP